MAKQVSNRICAFEHCSNSGYQLRKWSEQVCEIHETFKGFGRCVCEPPFKLLTFPTKDLAARSVWTVAVQRKSSKNQVWTPSKESRICSDHFPDKVPTKENPYPTLNVGRGKVITPRLPPKERVIPQTPFKKTKLNDDNSMSSGIKFEAKVVSVSNNINNKDAIIANLRAQVYILKKENVNLKSKLFNVKNVLTCDKKVRFYTGIPTLESFNCIYTKVIEPYLKEVRYWRGPKVSGHVLKTKKTSFFETLKTGPKRQLGGKDEFLLTLMKCRLGLLFEDLGDRFGVSATHASRTFATWIRLLSKILGRLIHNPTKDVVKNGLPPSFRNKTYENVRHIIDCSEVFLETPQNLVVKTQTWSDYKHHHTAKYLVSITPCGMINYISSTWGGRASDKFLTNNSGFLDIIEPYDKVMADKGFPIAAELALLNAELIIPPGRRGITQMSKADVEKTKCIANRRIYVEQAIRRMKTFRILKYELPITMIQHLDHIIQTVGGICNLYKPLPRYN